MTVKYRKLTKKLGHKLKNYKEMKTFRYKNTTSTIWTSFDYGEVQAENRDDAERMAIERLTEDLELVNHKLSQFATTKGFSISMDMDQIEIEEVIPETPRYDMLCDIGFTVLSNSEVPTNDEVITALERRLEMLKNNTDEIQEAYGIVETFDTTA